MKEKKDTPPKSTPGVLERTFHEILIADKRTYEPFVKVFRVEGENISKLDLGTLVGVFEVDEKDEDAAYIVNFLASVAKKEYFNNPRRGPIESFEAALHKVNVALSELVKHGNVSWLGKLHGVLAVLEKNNLHFSVTGEAALLLFRQEQFSEISEGLATSEADIHPLKTFVEVSSGRLMADDTVILATQELLALFPLDYLAKQAIRMNPEDFRRFLRTALVNEIDMAAVLAIELTQATPEPSRAATPKEKKDPRPKNQTVANAFSQATFSATKPPTATLEQPISIDTTPTVKDEFIDEKTGHIYVQGDEIGDGTSLKHSVILDSLHEMTSQMGAFFSRTVRRQGKKTARLGAFLLWQGRTQTARLTRKTTQKIHSLKTTLAEQQAARKAQKVRQSEKQARQEAARLAEVPEKVVTPVVAPSGTVVNEIPEPALVNSHPTEVVHEANTPPHIERFRSLYQNKTTSTVSDPPAPKTPPQKTVSSKPAVNYAQSFQAWKQVVQRWLQKVMLSLWTLTQVLLKHKKILLITLGGLLVVGGLSFWFLRFAPQQETSNSQTPSPSPSVATTPLSATNTLQPESSLTLNKELVALAFLENQGYGATSNSIIALDTKEEFSVPDIKGEIRFLAPMADLRLLFILTSQNELFAWSPLAKTFTKQELSLPLNARVTGIGTYLTYLYVLDRGNNQLYRYPRSTPGFTESTNWMKESFELTDTAYLAINETVALAPSREHLLAFSQGKTTGDFVFQNPEAPINIQALTTDSDFPFMYALGENSVLSIWNLDRKLLHTYTLKEAPEDALYLATDPEKNILLVGNKKGTVTRYTNVQSE